LDGRIAAERQKAWAVADVFCSLSDNIQETFGITPIEAMAAGLPVVVSDWDGYKDTVRDGIDGFRIQTLMPEAGLGKDLAFRHALEIDSYDLYCGFTSALIAVDVQAAADAFVLLFESCELRQKMGASARERARSVYDWKIIIGQYEELWGNLNELRAMKSTEINSLKHPWPARMDPFFAFANYPTQTLTLDTNLKLNGTDIRIILKYVQNYQQLNMVKFAQMLLPTKEELNIVLEKAVKYPQGATAKDVISEIADSRKSYVLRSLVWLVKLGVLSVVKP
jgi:hypothetical protein